MTRPNPGPKILDNIEDDEDDGSDLLNDLQFALPADLLDGGAGSDSLDIGGDGVNDLDDDDSSRLFGGKGDFGSSGGLDSVLKALAI